MSKMGPGLLVETDLIAAYLVAPPGTPTALRSLMGSYVCYTTFVQAAEIYAAADTDQHRRTVDTVLFGLKILGASSRYAKTIARVLSSLPVPDHRTAIVAAIAMESDLPVVTDKYTEAYAGIAGLRLMATPLVAGAGE